MSEGKLLCELNGCSDCHDRQYPECDIRPAKMPSVCPKRPDCSKLVNAVNFHDQLVKALKKLHDATFADAVIPDWPTFFRGIIGETLKAAGEEV